MANIGLTEEQVDQVLKDSGFELNDLVITSKMREAISIAIAKNNEILARNVEVTIRQLFKEHDQVKHGR